MKCATVLAALAFSAAVSSVHGDGAAPPPGSKTWSYKTNDASVYGPAQWGALYPACSGTRQSPIDIPVKKLCGDASAPRDQLPLVFSGECPKYKVKQLYDAYKVESANGTCSVTAQGKPFAFLQSHFHAPSEHTLQGKAYDGEVHFVHKSDTDGLLVIGLFLQKSSPSAPVVASEYPYLTKFFKEIETVTTDKPSEAKLASFFPLLENSMAAGRVFSYPGSLTNPTCDETVSWFVLEKPLVVAASDFDALQVHLKRIEASDDGKAARPTQPLNGREVNVY